MEIVSTKQEISELLKHPFVNALLESTSDGAVVIDAKTRSVMKMNEKAKDLLGYSQQNVVGCDCSELMNSPVCNTSCPINANMNGIISS